ncbi:MAG: hypothetical protein JSW65_07150 [Candidatus Bipolaricaulota bacterium]|nr:MAG: hypothetical protein JSW65_07150 [Candidatus Bipolaricaulota bacterium]
MERFKSSVGGALLAAVLAALVSFAVLGADCTCVVGDCFEDIVITGAGMDAARGTYHFVGIVDGRPSYENSQGVVIYHRSTRWYIDQGRDGFYRVSSNAIYPPTRGWDIYEAGDIPLPQLSGGAECGAPPELYGVELYAHGPEACCGAGWTAVGGKVRLRLYPSRALAETPVVTIMGHNVQPTANRDGTVWEAYYVLTEEDPEGDVVFTIDYESIGGMPGPQVTTTTDGSGCIFDKTPPSVPGPLSPADGSTVPSDSVTFEWTPSIDDLSDHVYYTLYVFYYTLYMTGFEINLGTAGGSWTSTGLPERTYTWYMTASDRSRNKSAWSPARTFTIDYPDGHLIISLDWNTSSRVEEGGGSCYRFGIGLSSAPVADVEVTVAIDTQLRTEQGQPGEDLVILFTPSAWGPEMVCLYAVDDGIIEDYQQSSPVVTTSSDDPIYDGLIRTVYMSIWDSELVPYGIILPAIAAVIIPTVVSPPPTWFTWE